MCRLMYIGNSHETRSAKGGRDGGWGRLLEGKGGGGVGGPPPRKIENLKNESI